MQSTARFFISGVLTLFTVVGGCYFTASAPLYAADETPTLHLIGDSTVKCGTPGQRGWGEEIDALFDTTRINVDNHAIGGRSSRTFITEGRWEKVRSALKPGDFVIMQFGHNDGGKLAGDNRERGTIKGIGDESTTVSLVLQDGKVEEVYTYGWYMRKYITETKEQGAVPIVCSPVPRKFWNEGKVGRNNESYGGWAKAVAEQEDALFIDLNDIIAGHYEKLGQEKVEDFFADHHTHQTVEGAQLNAACVIEGLQALKECKLNNYVLPEKWVEVLGGGESQDASVSGKDDTAIEQNQ